MTQTAAALGHDPQRRLRPAARHPERKAIAAPLRVIAPLCCAMALGFSPAVAGDLEPTGLSMSSGATTGAAAAIIDDARMDPRISGTLHQKTELKLRDALQVAVEHLRTNPGCRDLFAQLGADGLEKLSTSLYYRSDVTMERRICGSGVSAFTIIGSPQVRLCRRFGSLATERAAAALIHEALHYAGMTERPRDPQGPSPADINRMVNNACKL